MVIPILCSCIGSGVFCKLSDGLQPTVNSSRDVFDSSLSLKCNIISRWLRLELKHQQDTQGRGTVASCRSVRSRILSTDVRCCLGNISEVHDHSNYSSPIGHLEPVLTTWRTSILSQYCTLNGVTTLSCIRIKLTCWDFNIYTVPCPANSQAYPDFTTRKLLSQQNPMFSSNQEPKKHHKSSIKLSQTLDLTLQNVSRTRYT